MTNEHNDDLMAWIMVNGKLKAVGILEWGLWVANPENRSVDHTELPDGVEVNTIFLGIDSGFRLRGNEVAGQPPILFETMIFGGKFDRHQWRYASLGEAKRGHWIIVDWIRSGREDRPVLDFGESTIWNLFREMFEE